MEGSNVCGICITSSYVYDHHEIGTYNRCIRVPVYFILINKCINPSYPVVHIISAYNIQYLYFGFKLNPCAEKIK